MNAARSRFIRRALLYLIGLSALFAFGCQEAVQEGASTLIPATDSEESRAASTSPTPPERVAAPFEPSEAPPSDVSESCAATLVFSVFFNTDSMRDSDGIYSICIDGSNLHQIVSKQDVPEADQLEPITEFAVSPDGKSITFAVNSFSPESTRVYVKDRLSGDVIELLSVKYYIRELQWDDTGQFLGYLKPGSNESGSLDQIEIFSLATSTFSQPVTEEQIPSQSSTYTDSYFTDFSWSPDGDHITYGVVTTRGQSSEPSMRLAAINCDMQTGICQTGASEELEWAAGMRLSWNRLNGLVVTTCTICSPDAQRTIEFRGTDGELVNRIDLSGTELELVQLTDDPSISPDAKYIAFPAYSGAVYILSLEDLNISSLNLGTLSGGSVASVRWLL